MLENWQLQLYMSNYLLLIKTDSTLKLTYLPTPSHTYQTYIINQFLKVVEDLGGIVWYGEPNATDIWQPVNAGYGLQIKGVYHIHHISYSTYSNRYTSRLIFL